MWIARDKDGRLYIFTEQPKRSGNEWLSEAGDFAEVPKNLFLGLTWESMPIEVELIRKPKIQKKKNDS